MKNPSDPEVTMAALEFTIRNKSKNPILTLKPAVLQLMLDAEPDVSNLVLARYCRTYKALTGKAISLDHEQTLALLQRYGADKSGMWTSAYAQLPLPWFLVIRNFCDGFLANSATGFKEDLEIAAAFYELLKDKVATPAS